MFGLTEISESLIKIFWSPKCSGSLPYSSNGPALKGPVHNTSLSLWYNISHKLVDVCYIVTCIYHLMRPVFCLSRAPSVYLQWWLCSASVSSSFYPDFPASDAALLCNRHLQSTHPRFPPHPQETNCWLPATTRCGDRRVISGRCPWQPTALWSYWKRYWMPWKVDWRSWKEWKTNSTSTL